MDEYPLTQYDEFPIHQVPYPFSYVPATDYSWDDGYGTAIYNADLGIMLCTGMRVAPNSDTVGAYASTSLRGVQRTVRVSRIWRPNCDTVVGPLRYRFIESFRDIHLSLEKNESGISFDVHWLGLGPAFQNSHHRAVTRSRRTTDQTRYSQVGCAEGWLRIDDHEIRLDRNEWFAMRDHSWGLYEARPPLSQPPASFLPPPAVPAARRAFRLGMFIVTSEFSGQFHLHEDESGRQVAINDVWGTPFEGALDWHWEKRLELVGATHDLKFTPGTRSMERGSVVLSDEDGGRWTLDLEVVAPPFVIIPTGYRTGSWKDGGNIHTYHSAPETYLEWDQFDFSVQPANHTLYGETQARKVYGVEHITRLRCVDPSGNIILGRALVEIFSDWRYPRYGFEAPAASSRHAMTGRGVG